MELTYNSAANTLRLTPSSVEVGDEPTRVQTLDGILDIGEGGRLIGVEFPATTATLALWLDDPTTNAYLSVDASSRAYVEISPLVPGSTTRSTPITLTAQITTADQIAALDIPRRGHGYEISYPSGNQ